MGGGGGVMKEAFGYCEHPSRSRKAKRLVDGWFYPFCEMVVFFYSAIIQQKAGASLTSPALSPLIANRIRNVWRIIRLVCRSGGVPSFTTPQQELTVCAKKELIAADRAEVQQHTSIHYAVCIKKNPSENIGKDAELGILMQQERQSRLNGRAETKEKARNRESREQRSRSLSFRS